MASSSTSFVHKTFTYDVFLSFRGEDTRTNFVDHLYHALQHKGIHTYKDDERIKKGQKICDELIGSIEDSKFYIIVFSKNYASSSWCLDELVKIMECHKTPKHTAYPIFYDVEPSEVRKQSGAVGKAFAKQENEKAAGKWRVALKEAADLSGWELKKTVDGHEAKFIQKIIEELSLELREIDFNIDEKLVGMETRIKDVFSSLEIGFDDVRMIGIKGMGGGGKTTLARAIFDQISFQFEGTIFVENVREVSKASLSNLQNQILSNVLNGQAITVSSVHDGKNMMKRRMPCKKVLLVLDDVDYIEQLEALAGDTNWFKSGSRIIITTRDEQVLVSHGVKLIHNVQLLSKVEANRLFSRYAFGRVIPKRRYEELSQQVVHYAAGLPLTIKVLGSFLCGKNELEWIDALKRLKKIPLKKTLEILEISYIDLEKDYKEIFLNVACILKGLSKAYAIEVLESCGFDAIIGLKVLEQKSLITVHHYVNRYSINDNGYLGLGMHDHIEEMGKDIVRRLHLDKPNKHSRLWINEEIEDILTNDSGTEATRYIQFRLNKLSPEIAMKGLRKMKELRYLRVYGGDIDATTSACSLPNWKFNEFLNALQYLSWNHYPFRSLPETFQANNLVTLVLSKSRIVQLWEGGDRKVLNKLRFLDLSYSDLRTLDLGLAPNLETLNLKRCFDLIELHFPHRCKNLRSLKLNYIKVKTLDIGQSPNLEYLDLRNCHDLEEFHIANGCLKKLFCLDLSGCVRFTSFCFHTESDASYATHDADDLSVEDFSSPYCTDDYAFRSEDYAAYGTEDYVSCSEDDTSCSEDELLDGDPLAELHLIAKSLDICPFHPDSVLPKFQFKCYYKEYQPLSTRNLEKLISVGLCACTNLDMFSRSICGLQHLRKLRITGGIPEPPKDLDQLGCLEKLEFSHTSIKHLPDNICMLKHLKSLKVKSCPLLERLPEDLGQLECLKKLTLTRVMIKNLPDSICKLKLLESLKVKSRSLLEKLPEDLGRLECLKKLTLTTVKIKDLPDSIFKLKQLESLKVKYHSLLEKLPEDIGRLKCLKKLALIGAGIKDLPESICMLKDLESLELHCLLLKKLPEDIDRLEHLKKIKLSSGKIKELPDSICMLKHLESLELCCSLLDKLPKFLGRLECLEMLNLSYCESLRDIPDSICNMKRLKHLYLGCTGVETLPEELGSLKGLRTFASRRLLQSYRKKFKTEESYSFCTCYIGSGGLQ